MKQYPRLLMQFDINDHDDRVHALRRADCQLAVIEKYMLSDEMEYKDLLPEEYILVVCAKWKKRRLREVVQNERMIDFDPHDQMTFNYLKEFGLSEQANRDRYFVNRTDVLALMISNGLGYGVLPLEFAKPYLAKKQLAALNSSKTYQHPLVLAWFPRHQQPEYFSALIGACE
jgi:DNA-binding transcriptional LysR family regulator